MGPTVIIASLLSNTKHYRPFTHIWHHLLVQLCLEGAHVYLFAIAVCEEPKISPRGGFWDADAEAHNRQRGSSSHLLFRSPCPRDLFPLRLIHQVEPSFLSLEYWS